MSDCFLIKDSDYCTKIFIKKLTLLPCQNIFSVLFTYRGEVMNGGFGLLLDGSEEAAKRARLMLNWDVSNGVRAAVSKLFFFLQNPPVQMKLFSDSLLDLICSCVVQVARRCWSGNSNAYDTIQRTMEENRQLRVTMPFPVQDEHVLDRALQG